MNLSKEQIIAAAPPELKEIIPDFVCPGDTYLTVSYKIENGKLIGDSISFVEYAYCVDYQQNGEYVTMRYLSLNTFPPTPKILNLKIPHIIMGHYVNQDNTIQVQMKKINSIFAVAERLE